MMSRTRRGLDGPTAFELKRGSHHRKMLPPLGEKVMYVKPKPRLEDHWMEGLLLGVQDRPAWDALGASSRRSIR